MKKLKISSRHREWLFGYLFVGLWVIGFIAFTLFPMVQSFIYSLKEVRISSDGLQIVSNQGFKNYYNAFTYIYFVEALWNYIVNTVIIIPSIIVFSIILGILLNQKIRFRGIFRTIYFLPVIISSGPVLSKIQSEGAMQLSLIGNGSWLELMQSILPKSLSDIFELLFSKIILIMWFTGVPTILVIAGLQKIDKSIYESAAIDGAGAWESFWKITLPALKPLVNIIIIYSIISISLFSSNEVVRIIDSRKLEQFGLSNAFAWIYFVVTILLLLTLLGLANIKVHKKKRALG